MTERGCLDWLSFCFDINAFAAADARRNRDPPEGYLNEHPAQVEICCEADAKLDLRGVEELPPHDIGLAPVRPSRSSDRCPAVSTGPKWLVDEPQLTLAAGLGHTWPLR